MKTHEHLYHLKKCNYSNGRVKPLMNKVYMLILSLKPSLKYYGYCEIYFLKTSDKGKKIKVYFNDKYIKILKIYLIYSLKYVNEIKEKHIKKGDSCFYTIFSNYLNLKGLYRLIVYFYYESVEEKIEGIYVSESKKKFNEEIKLITTDIHNLKKKKKKKHIVKCPSFKTTWNYFYFRKNYKLVQFKLNGLKFKHTNNYSYINTFCELFYLPTIFPCLNYNIHKIKFKLYVSFQVTLNNNTKCVEKYLHFYKHLENSSVETKNYFNLSLTNLSKFCKNNTKKKYDIDIINPPYLVISNSKLKKVYYSNKQIWGKYFSFSLHKKCHLEDCDKTVALPSQVIHNILPNVKKIKKRGKGQKKKKIITKIKYSLCLHSNNNRSIEHRINKKKEKGYITYEFFRTKYNILNYTFCLFVGLYNKVHLKIKRIPIFIYIEKNNENKQNEYVFFINILKNVLLMLMKINICLKKKITDNNFLQFIILNKYKYVGEENHNCLTFLSTFIKINGSNNNFYKILSVIKIIVHEIFHILWGNCIYIKDEKNLWCKEGLTRFYELIYTKLIFKKIKTYIYIHTCINYSNSLLQIYNILQYYFYILTIDTLNIYNHTLQFSNSNVYKNNKIKKNKQKIYNNCNSSYKYDVNSFRKSIFYERDIHHFYNPLTYNKGMNIFKIITILCTPYFRIIIKLLYYNFYNHSINKNKLFAFINFFFFIFRIKPFFFNYKKEEIKSINNQNKRINNFFQSCTPVYKNKISKNFKIRIKYKRNLQSYNNKYVFFQNFYSPFLKLSFKKLYKIYCNKISKFHLNCKDISVKKWNTVFEGIRIMRQKEKLYFTTLNIKHIKKNINIKYIKQIKCLNNILKNYINIVGPPKLFIKYFKNKNKLLIRQKHYYYDNYAQKIKETNNLFKIPFIFKFNNKTYKILVTKKSTLVDLYLLWNENNEECKTTTIEVDYQNKINFFNICFKNNCYFSYHFVDMNSFSLIINSIKNNKCSENDIFYIVVNIILHLLVRVKSLQHAKYLNYLVCKQIFLVYKALKVNATNCNKIRNITAIFCIEFFKCYMHFSKYFRDIENRKLKLMIRKELINSTFFGEIDKDIEFLFQDFINYLSKIFYLFKESISLLQ
ncbi:M1-family alanyl aminopeptidase, putative [Plasmodium berghei]|uniref:M1-family alanyl aminopeptidase, putative n=2 Tax=Plasmodium berghei TaxID=5821 RepID=A0A509AQ07_PLABA|nr:M1-family alanyl aminopeptidase, putative [Plasmodium berghei ANKA]CXI97467.1 M1-family alanyl aminopeptidase, putative [Plasmodium berghei]SCL97539.1 M1-family alanyl aminopeptidase, putative [Plasmodium berghei]SCM16630.1 M1-family alanyl aminopeptidase, putative [Plasmodium berghei]SCM18427.1 M1-family alanyl aminopeptidase, putative [Plasmodium berghei]SCN27857.1 M1-family alanyl aminopeptidase, putative [Plasmodium berghei]|eukprot:XP_034423512.1 M1-family alanyl aminopeptidase, putative [Plasmodium berghei ANKA]